MFNKRIWLTGALAIIAIFAVVFIQRAFTTGRAAGTDQSAEEIPAATGNESVSADSGRSPASESGLARGGVDEGPVHLPRVHALPGGAAVERTVTLETDLIRAVFSTRGGTARSIMLKKFTDSRGLPIEMVLSEDSGEYPFAVRMWNGAEAPILSLLEATTKRAGDRRIAEFTGDFAVEGKGTFRLIKRITLREGEYLIRADVEAEVLEGDPFGEFPFSFALEIGPQIGPDYRELNNRTEYRFFSLLQEDTKRSLATSGNSLREIEDSAEWAGVEGKYFAFLGAGAEGGFLVAFDSRTTEGLRRKSSYLISPAVDAGGSSSIGSCYFYVGPKAEGSLVRYNSAEANGFGVGGMHFEKVLPRRRLISRLAELLRGILRLFYYLIPNFGVAIILLALLIRGGLVPLAIRQERSKEKLRLFNIKADEIRKRYPEDQGYAEQKVRELYVQDKVRPVSRIWPLLIQLPILVALYSLLNSHFDLRGAVFIPGWINDLSLPDIAADLLPRRVPVIRWSSINFLPFLLFGVLLVQARVVERPEKENRMQVVFSFLFPLVVLLIVYNLPSGVALYFFFYSVFGIVQHYMIRRYRHRVLSPQP